MRFCLFNVKVTLEFLLVIWLSNNLFEKQRIFPPKDTYAKGFMDRSGVSMWCALIILAHHTKTLGAILAQYT